MSATRIGCGCAQLGSATNRAPARSQIRLVHQAIDMGCTVFDTSDAYGAGSSERMLGRAIRGRRDEVTIATKGGYVVRERSAVEQRLRRGAAKVRTALPRRDVPPTGGRSYDPLGTDAGARMAQDFSPAHLVTAVEGSLRRLIVDHIDVYQLHGASTCSDDAMAALLALRDAGKIGAIGLGAETYAAVEASMQVPELDLVQLPFGLLDPEPLEGLFDHLGRAGRTVWIRGVLGGGLFARAMTSLDLVRDHPKSARIRAFQRLAQQYGMPLDELAIRWACSVASPNVLLVGMSSESHLARNLAHARAAPLPGDLSVAVTAVALGDD